MNYRQYMKNKIVNKLKYLWGNIYFAFDKYNEFDTNFEYQYIDCAEYDYCVNIIYNYMDNIFGKNLYRFSSRKLLNEMVGYYGKFSFDRNMCKYNERTELSNLYNGSLCIRLAYFVQNDKLFDIAQNLITKIYDSLIQCVINNYRIEEIKSAKIYKFYNDNEGIIKNHRSNHVGLYDTIFRKYNIPRIIIDKFDKNNGKDYYNTTIYKYYMSEDNKFYYYYDEDDIFNDELYGNEDDKCDKDFIKSILSEYSNKIYLQNIFKNFVGEVISKDNKKYLIYNNFPNGLNMIPHGTSFTVPDFKQLMREYTYNYIEELNNNNNSLSNNSTFFKFFNSMNNMFSLNSIKEFNLIKEFTNVEEHVKNVTNNLDYNKCDNIEDFMAQFCYYLDKKYYNFNIKEIYL